MVTLRNATLEQFTRTARPLKSLNQAFASPDLKNSVKTNVKWRNVAFGTAYDKWTKLLILISYTQTVPNKFIIFTGGLLPQLNLSGGANKKRHHMSN